MNALAATIAYYGLLSSSAAVVTATAMLLGPIAGVALRLTEKDRGRGAMYDALRFLYCVRRRLSS